MQPVARGSLTSKMQIEVTWQAQTSVAATGNSPITGY